MEQVAPPYINAVARGGKEEEEEAPRAGDRPPRTYSCAMARGPSDAAPRDARCVPRGRVSRRGRVHWAVAAGVRGRTTRVGRVGIAWVLGVRRERWGGNGSGNTCAWLHGCLRVRGPGIYVDDALIRGGIRERGRQGMGLHVEAELRGQGMVYVLRGATLFLLVRHGPAPMHLPIYVWEWSGSVARHKN